MHPQSDSIKNNFTLSFKSTVHHRLYLSRLRINTLLKQIAKLVLFIHILIYLMIAYIKCSLYNPGPPTRIANISGSSSTNIISDKLSIYYQNVQGLIPFTELNKPHPNLDSTKLCELHAYIYNKCPDIVVLKLNETWLKNCILDGEIFPSDRYKIFRKDRTHFCHPPDPDNP